MRVGRARRSGPRVLALLGPIRDRGVLPLGLLVLFVAGLAWIGVAATRAAMREQAR